jgi:hypothetical protein
LHIIGTVALTIQSAEERAKARYAYVTRQSASTRNSMMKSNGWPASVNLPTKKKVDVIPCEGHDTT